MGNPPYPSSLDDWQSHDDEDFSQIPFHDSGSDSDSDSEQDSGHGFWDESESESWVSSEFFLCCLNYIYIFIMLKFHVCCKVSISVLTFQD